MPKRIPSKGSIVITSPFETFITWLRNEVRNMHEWNPKLGWWSGNNRYNFVDDSWIHFMRTKIVVKSDKPTLWLRKGLGINMGHGRIEIS